MGKGRSILVVLFLLLVIIASILHVRYISTLISGVSVSVSDSTTKDETIPRTLPFNQSSAFVPSCPAEYKMDNVTMFEYGRIQHNSPLNSASSDQNQVFTQKVLILTPISNVGHQLASYFRLVCSLSYPHHLISVALGEDSSKDKSLQVAAMYSQKLQDHFHRVEVHHFDQELAGRPRHTKHDEEWQLKRRSHLAKARNRLLSVALRDEEWILWLDADVKFAPPDLLQHLMSARGDVTSVPCMYRVVDGLRNYDRNSWQETDTSRSFLEKQAKNYLMLEGYGDNHRRFLADIRDQGEVVKLDGVGGCALLVKADCHRQGLVFPTFVFNNHIETEGLAKLAKEMDFTVKGLPFVFVIHGTA